MSGFVQIGAKSLDSTGNVIERGESRDFGARIYVIVF